MSTEIVPTDVSEAEPKENNVVKEEETETPEQLEERAKKLFTDGKRSLVCEQFSEAVDTFAECCDLFSRRFGEMAIECVDPYINYANSLLQLERSQPKVVKTADEDVEEESSGSDEEAAEGENDENNECQEKAVQKIESDETGVNGAGEEAVKIEVSADKRKADDSSDVPGSSADRNNGFEGDKVELESNASKEEMDGEDDGLGLAWNMADLARHILETHCNNDETRIRLANCRLLLGEIQVANERFEDAINEFKSCLDIYSDALPADDRSIAEVYFHIGSACHLDDKYDSAAEYFQKAVTVLELRKTNFENLLKGGDSSTTDLDQTKKEIEEISSLIFDLTQRMTDMVESQTQKTVVQESLQQLTSRKAVSQAVDVSNTEASNVSHLVRKTAKRALVESETGLKEEEAKKTKLENGTHQEHLSATNGHASVVEEKLNEAGQETNLA